MTDQIEIHTLAGAYVLDAVDDVERAAFDRHLRQCTPCAVEVAELQMTTERMASAVAADPPPRMRAAVLAEISRTPQQRATRTSREPATATRWRRWTAASVAAAILSIGVGVSTWTVADQRVQEQRQLAADIRSVLTAPDVRMLVAPPPSVGGRLTVFVSPSRDAAVAFVEQFANPGDERAYQLWMIEGSSTFTNADVLDAGTGSGTSYIAGLGSTDSIGVTQEPAGGSKQPSSSPVAGVTLRA